MRILQQLRVVALGQGLSRVLYLVSLVVVARMLGSIGFGLFMESFALVALFTNLMDFGFSSLATRELASGQARLDRPYLRHLIAGKVLVLAASLLLLAFVANWLLELPAKQLLTLVLAVGFAATSCQMLVDAIYYSTDRPSLTVGFALLQRLLFLVLAPLSVLLWRSPLAVACCYTLAALLPLVWAYLLLKCEIDDSSGRWLGAIDRQRFGQLFRHGTGLVLLGLTTSIYGRIDVVLLGQLTNAAVVGLYSGAYKILEALLFIGMIYRLVIYPLASRLHGKHDEQLRLIISETLRGTVLVVVPAALLLSAAASLITAVLLGEQFADAGVLLAVLALAWPFAMLNNVLLFTVLALHKDQTALAISGAGLVLNVVLNLWLIPYYGALASAWITVATEALVTSLLLAVLWRSGLLQRSVIEGRLWGTALAASVAVVMLTPLNPVLGAAAQLLITVGLVRWLRVLNRVELQLVRLVLQRQLA